MDKIIIELGLYPVMIRQSRYSGIYEGGLWFAVPGYESIESTEAFTDYLHGNDCDAVDFWSSPETEKFGVGATPDEALLDLIKKHTTSIQIESENPQYLSVREKFESDINERKEPFSTGSGTTAQIHVERTSYFEISSGYKQDDRK